MNSIPRAFLRSLKYLYGKGVMRANCVFVSKPKIIFNSIRNLSILTMRQDVAGPSLNNMLGFRSIGTIIVKHDDRRFYIVMNNRIAQLKYSIENGVMDIKHTGVPQSLGGHGLGKLLAMTALDYAATKGLRLKISCGFVKHYVNEYAPQYLKHMV